MHRLFLVFSTLSGLALGGRPAPRTALVVVVETDLAVPAELQSVRAVVGDGACTDTRCVHDFVTDAPNSVPFSFTLEPRGASDARFTLTITGRDAGGSALVERHVDTGFVPGTTRLLVVGLSGACRTRTCPGGDTCVAGACVSATIDPATLPVVEPGHELDGRDAGPSGDASDDVADVPSPATPRSCFELPASAPSGPTDIDPDGAGGAPAFRAFCDNTSEGGGWTLIAKVDPGSSRLAHDAAEWTAPTPEPFGTPDEAAGDALLAPYWTVPVQALRFVVAGRTIVAPMTGFRGTLRAAMDARPVFEGPASRPMPWGDLVADSLHPGSPPCVRAGVDPVIPDGSTTLRARLGLVGSAAADCSEPTFWYGVAPSLVPTGASSCDETTSTSAGGERLCGPPGQRRDAAQTVLVYGR